jgi:hypothetical protein
MNLDVLSLACTSTEAFLDNAVAERKFTSLVQARYRTEVHTTSRYEHTSNGDVTRFSTTRTTPSFDLTPMAVVPSCKVR